MADMRKIARVQTGLAGLDNVLQGGLPTGSVTLLSGACGTGKSTLAMQFLYNGAKYMGEPGVYVTLEEDPKKLIENMTLFGWGVDDLIAKKKLMVIKPEVYKFESIKQIISDAIDKIHAKRLVVDSYSVLLTYFSDPYEIRNGLVQLDREIKKMECTALVISDIKDNSEIFSTTGVEEFIVDGVIVLYLIKSHSHPFEFERAISVRKMRATHHPLKTYPFQITKEGITIGGKHITGPLHGSHSGVGTMAEHIEPLEKQVKAPAAEKKEREKTHSPKKKTESNAKTKAKIKQGKPAKAKKKTVPKKAGREPRSSTSIDIKALRAPGAQIGHSWKWRHL